MLSLKQDTFEWDKAVGKVSGTYDRTGQVRTVRDDSSYLSISGGRVRITGGAGFGQPGMTYERVKRKCGLALYAKGQFSTPVVQGVHLGFSSIPIPTTNLVFAGRGFRIGNGAGVVKLFDGTNTQPCGSYTAGTDQEFLVVLRDTGSHLYTRGGFYTTSYWTLLYVLANDSTSDLYPGFIGNDTAFNFDEISVVDLSDTSVLGSQWGGASAYLPAPRAGAAMTMPQDAVLEFTWTPSAGATLELSCRYANANNRIVARCQEATSLTNPNTVALISVRNGVEIPYPVAPVACTFTAGTAYRIVLIPDGTTCQVFVNGVNKVSVSGSTSTDHLMGGSLFVADTAGTDMAVWPRFRHADELGLYPTGVPRTLEPLNYIKAIRATAALTTPTYDTSGQAIHADVLYRYGGVPAGSSSKYVMALTPYPAGNSDYENPSILVSADGNTWAVPDGLTNPIVAKPANDANAYNSDPDIIFVDHPSGGPGTFYLYFREVQPTIGAVLLHDILKVTTSLDLVTWTDPVALRYADASVWHRFMSPAVCYYGGKYLMFYCDRLTASNDGNKLYRMESDHPLGPWGNEVEIPISLPSGDIPYHLDVITDPYNPEILWAFILRNPASYCYLCRSADGGYTWTTPSVVTLSGSAAVWDITMYRSSLIRTPDGFDMFYSAYAAGTVSHIGRGHIYYPGG